MRIARLAFAILALCAPAGASSVAGAAEDGPILPGYWESTSKSSFAASKTERKCVSPDQINSYLTGPSNPHYTCKYDKRRVENGHASMEGECINSGVRAHIKINGTYTATSFNLIGHLQANLGGLAIPMEASIDAHRLSGVCPASGVVDDKKKGER